MKLTLEFNFDEKALPLFKIGDRVMLEDDIQEWETPFAHTPGTVVDVTVEFRDRRVLSLKNWYTTSTDTSKWAMWTVHVKFDGSETIETSYEGNLVKL